MQIHFQIIKEFCKNGGDALMFKRLVGH